MTGWCRLWHDMPTDPKWRVIARKSGQPLPCVIALFTMLMTNASVNAAEPGTLSGWTNEDAAAALDMDEADVAAIIDTMQGRVLDGDRLTGWEKRQPRREDSSAERMRKLRARRDAAHSDVTRGDADVTQRDAGVTHGDADVTQRDAGVTHGDAPDADADADADSDTTANAVVERASEKRPRRRAHRLPHDWQPEPLPPDVRLDPARIDDELARFRDWAKAAPDRTGLKRDWQAAWRNWCRRVSDERSMGGNGRNGAGAQQYRRNPAAELLAEALAEHEAERDAEGDYRGAWPALSATA